MAYVPLQSIAGQQHSYTLLLDRGHAGWFALDRYSCFVYPNHGSVDTQRRTSMTSLPARETAWALLCEYTTSDSLRKHALGVEAVMRAYARHYGGDEDRWGMVGLLHDFDYERYPTMEGHPIKGS